MLAVFTKDVVFLSSFNWSWGVVTFAVRIRRLVIHCVATGRSTPGRCACTGAVVWARDRHGSRRRRRSLRIVVGLLVLLAAAGVARRSTGRWAWNLADRRGYFLVTC